MPEQPTSWSHPLDDRKPLPFGDVDRADGARRQVDRARRGHADTADDAACGRERRGDQASEGPPRSPRRHRRASAAAHGGRACRRRRRARRRLRAPDVDGQRLARPSVPVGVVGLALDRRDARSRQPSRTSSARRTSSQSRNARRRAAPRRWSATACAPRPAAEPRPSPCANRFRCPTAARSAAGCARGSRRCRHRWTSTSAATCVYIALARGSASAAAAMLPISSRAESSGSSSLFRWRSRAGDARVRRPPAAITRSVTKSCVSHRRNCLPSLVPARGSAAAGIASLSVASRASTSSTGTALTGHGRHDVLIAHRTVTFAASGVEQPSRAADPDQRPPLPRLHPRRRRDVETDLRRLPRRHDGALRGGPDPLPRPPRADHMGLQRQARARGGADRQPPVGQCSPAVTSTPRVPVTR